MRPRPSNWPTRAVLSLLAMLIWVVAAATSTTPSKAATASDIESDADWILQAILPDGAIAHYPDRVMVRPYLSHFAAIGLVHAYRATGATKYIDGAWRWLAWYQDHMDTSGYVTDYNLVDGTLVSTGDMDSTDSYAGMFLVAAYNAHTATGDSARTAGLRAGIQLAVTAIESTIDSDGLSWSKPSYRVKYLMDQAETYAGLRSAAWLANNVLGDTALQARADADADRIKAGVAGLWNSSTGAYDWAKHESGFRQVTDWANLYSDAFQQVWAVAFGLVDGDTERANTLLSRFDSLHPNWDRPAATDRFDGVIRTIEYWPVAGWAFSRQGNLSRADSAATNIRTAAVAADRSWPYHTMAAGQLVALEAKAFEFFPATSGDSTIDTQPPTAPILTATRELVRKKTSPVGLSWTAALDNVGVTAYRVYRNGDLLATTSGLNYRDFGIVRNLTYRYSVIAADAAGNRSNPTNIVTVVG